MVKSNEQFSSIQNHLKNALFLKQQLKYEENRRKSAVKATRKKWKTQKSFFPPQLGTCKFARCKVKVHLSYHILIEISNLMCILANEKVSGP